MKAGTEYSKKKMAMYRNEVGALARASSECIPGAVKLVACPFWHGAGSLVLKYHGK